MELVNTFETQNSENHGIRELSLEEITAISGGANPLVPIAGAAVLVGGTALLAYGVYKGGVAVGLW